MFSGLTAWFSSSIGHKKKQKWLDNGGTEASFDDAEYIFSADADREDTKRIFASDAYLDEHLAVFHPNYIIECLKLGGPKSGLLGKYFLPPKDVQKLIREQMSLQWDIDGNTSDTDIPDAVQQKQPQPIPGPSNSKTNKSPRPQSSTATQKQTPAKSSPKATVQQEEEKEYLRLEDLAKTTGELTDFVPGRDGCEMVIR